MLKKHLAPIKVTILILIDGFLQYGRYVKRGQKGVRHNPYFNRWFSAIKGVIKMSNKLGQSQSLF